LSDRQSARYPMFTTKQKKRVRRLVVYFMLAALFVAGVSILYQWLSYRKAKLTRYPEFGIAIPDEYLIHGIDVSKYQHTIAWEEVQRMKVKNIQLGFTFIKATEGIGNIDEHFRRNWKRAREAGMIRGAYHFFISSKDGKMQAENFIDKVDLEPGDLPPVLDVEQLNGSTAADLKIEVKKWLLTAENHYQTKPIIYTNVEFYNRYLGHEFDAYPLWVAHYYQAREPRIKRGWVFWQHSDEGRVNGITSQVDFNVFHGDSIEFRNFLLR
jgi:lysozyme